MDHNNKHLLPGFHLASFPGLTGPNASAFMTLPSQMTNTMLNINSQLAPNWLEAAASMLPGYIHFNMKGIEDLNKQAELLGQPSLDVMPNQMVNGSAMPSIFPSSMSQPQGIRPPSAKSASRPTTAHVDSPSGGPLSNAPSSHPSTSTPHEIDVGGNSQPASQTQAYDLSMRNSPQVQQSSEMHDSRHSENNMAGMRPMSSYSMDTSRLRGGIDMAQPSTSTATDDWSSLNSLNESDVLGFFNSSQLNPKMSTNDPKLSSHAFSSPNGPSHDHDPHEDDFVIDLGFENDQDVCPFQQFSGISREPGGLSPVQFTPPDSPRGAGMSHDEPMVDYHKLMPSFLSPQQVHTNAAPVFVSPPPPKHADNMYDVNMESSHDMSFEEPAPELISPKPKKDYLTRPVQRSSKVPVYKQKRLLQAAEQNIPVHQPKTEEDADAYSFDAEDDHSMAKDQIRDRLDAEVKEKLSRIVSQQTGENKNVSCYVPGVGFAFPQEQTQDLWRHVVPKKRPVGENRPMIPAANLLPSSVHEEANQAAARLADPEIVTLAESIRRRKKDRFVCSFIKTEQTMSSECAKEDGADMRAEQIKKEMEEQPPLPKLVIKLGKKPVEEYVEKKHKKKKKKRKDDDDSDWEGSDLARRKRKKLKHERRRSSSGYEVRLIEPEISIKTEEKPEMNSAMYTKKYRFMSQWQNGQENGEHPTNGRPVQALPRASKSDFNTDAIKKRLSKFGPADGHLPKGTFVVCKADLFRDDCALWRVDNQNLLQKFPPRVDPTTRSISYKNSSTYSGWCDQIASGYYKVSIKHIKQSRSEAVIMPEIPLSDLFPAMTTEFNDTNGFIKNEEETPLDQNDHMMIMRDPLKLALYTYTQIMTDHALTLDYLQAMKLKNDWSFLQAVSEIDRINSECLGKLKAQCKMREEFENALQSYTQLYACDATESGSVFCQSCLFDRRPGTRIVQLLGMELYDRESLSPISRTYEDGSSSPLPAMEYVVCTQCATSAQSYHKCFHMKYHILKRCEDKLELLGTQFPDQPPERIVEAAKKSKTWQHKLIADYIDTWKRLQSISVSVPVTHE